MNITEDEIKVFEFLSDGKEHFDAPDIEDYDDICEYYAELGLISLGESMDNGIKLTYKGKRLWKQLQTTATETTDETYANNNERPVITKETTGRELSILLAARIAARNYNYESVRNFVELLREEYPEEIDNETSEDFIKKMHDSFSQRELMKVKDQASLVAFAENLNKWSYLKSENRTLANKYYLMYNTKSK